MPLVLISLFADLCRTAQLHNQIRSSLAVREKSCDRRWRRKDRLREGETGKNESTEDCGYVSRGKPQVGSGEAGLIRVFPLCDWVSH